MVSAVRHDARVLWWHMVMAAGWLQCAGLAAQLSQNVCSHLKRTHKRSIGYLVGRHTCPTP